jgi:hypothetical protein
VLELRVCTVTGATSMGDPATAINAAEFSPAEAVTLPCTLSCGLESDSWPPLADAAGAIVTVHVSVPPLATRPVPPFRELKVNDCGNQR